MVGLASQTRAISFIVDVFGENFAYFAFLTRRELILYSSSNEARSMMTFDRFDFEVLSAAF